MSHSSSKGRVSLIASCRGALLGVALLSGLINILYLSGSLYMMEVYDRVLPSRSIPTLSACRPSSSPCSSSRACSTCSAAASSPASAPRSTRT